MRAMIMASTIASGLLFGAAMPANALTVQPLPLADDAPAVTLVADGCGPGFHRGPYGHCRPNFYRPYGFYRPVYGFHRGYGWHHGWHHW